MRFFDSFELIQDRYLYLPSVGFCLIVGLSVKRFGEKPKWKTRSQMVGGPLLVCYLWLLFTQQNYYANREQIDLRTLKVAPSMPGTRDDLDGWYFAEREYFAKQSKPMPSHLSLGDRAVIERIYFGLRD
jgi:hypothetical protein